MHVTMKAVDVLRRLLPRRLRNFSRAPLGTVQTFGAMFAGFAGVSTRVNVTPDWAVRCHPASADYFRYVARDEETQREIASFLSQARDRMVVVDIGAHYGLMTLAALRCDGATVYSVEPSNLPRRVLAQNVRLAKAEDRVTILDCAIGPKDGELEMLTTGANALHFVVAAIESRPDSIRVPQMTLSSLFGRMKQPPTHLKMDIEGFELEALAGGEDALGMHRPLLFLELHASILRGRQKDPESVLNTLRGCGYRQFVDVFGREVTPESVRTADTIRMVCSPSSASPRGREPVPPPKSLT